MKSIPGNRFGLLLAGGLRAGFVAGINPRRRQKECEAAKPATLKREPTVVMVVVDDGGRVILQISYAKAESPRLLGAGCHATLSPGPDYPRQKGRRRQWSERKRPTKR